MPQPKLPTYYKANIHAGTRLHATMAEVIAEKRLTDPFYCPFAGVKWSKRYNSFSVTYDNKLIGYRSSAQTAAQLYSRTKHRARKAEGKLPKGVTFYKPLQKWRAFVTRQKVSKFLGYYATIRQAVAAINRYDAELHTWKTMRVQLNEAFRHYPEMTTPYNTEDARFKNGDPR